MKVAPIAGVAAIPILGGFIASKMAEAVIHEHLTQQDYNSSAKEEINSERLLIIVEKIEQIIETYNRFEAYLVEVQVIQQLGMSFQNWLKLASQKEAQQYEVETICIIPLQPL